MQQVLNFVKKHWLIISLAIIAAMIATLALYQPKEPQPSSSSTPISPIQAQELKPIGIFPPSNTEALGSGTTNAIAIHFSMPIDISTANVTTIPHTTIITTSFLSNDNTKLILQPNSPWETGEYLIVLHQGLRSLDHIYQLQKDLILRYNVIKPPRPTYDRPS